MFGEGNPERMFPLRRGARGMASRYLPEHPDMQDLQIQAGPCCAFAILFHPQGEKL